MTTRLYHDEDDERARLGRAWCPCCGDKMHYDSPDPEVGQMTGLFECNKCGLALWDGSEEYVDDDGKVVDMRAVKRADRMLDRAAREIESRGDP